jgi:hypothetical protein
VIHLAVVNQSLAPGVGRGGPPGAVRRGAGSARAQAAAAVTRRVFLILLVMGGPLVAVALQTKCAAGVQGLVTDRKHHEVPAQLQTELGRSPNDHTAMEWMRQQEGDQ